MKVSCPSCSLEFAVSLKAAIPDEQHIRMEITKDGFLDAKTLGGIITDTEILLRATAKDLGQRVCVFVSSVNVREDGTSIDFLITNVIVKKRKAPLGDGDGKDGE